MTHSEACDRVRKLVIARNALDEALQDALADLARIEAAEGAASVRVEPRFPPHQSGMRPRFEVPAHLKKGG